MRGEVKLEITFGNFLYSGTFFVLSESVPAILGMTFFTDVSPVVDWKQQSVHVDGMCLPVQCFGADVHNNVLGADMHTN